MPHEFAADANSNFSTLATTLCDAVVKTNQLSDCCHCAWIHGAWWMEHRWCHETKYDGVKFSNIFLDFHVWYSAAMMVISTGVNDRKKWQPPRPPSLLTGEYWWAVCVWVIQVAFYVKTASVPQQGHIQGYDHQGFQKVLKIHPALAVWKNSLEDIGLKWDSCLF